MTREQRARSGWRGLLLGLAGLAATACADETVHPSAAGMRPVGDTRLIDFETDEGTWVSVDVSPDGRWIVFDLLGQIYRMPVDGGPAENLTANSGVALNFHPAFSPDGQRLAFISDRSGQNNVWVMDADGGDPHAVWLDPHTRFTDPVWTPDGRAVVAVRAFRTPGRGWHRQTTSLWRLPVDGEEPAEILGGGLAHFRAPSFAPDGRLYYHVAYSTGDGLGLLQAGHRIQRHDPTTGHTENVRRNEAPEPSPEMQDALRRTAYASDVGGDDGAALNPEVSPDGRYLAFALEQKGETFSYRGHAFGPATALVVRDLESGDERRVLSPAPKELTQMNAQYSYRVFPGFAWTPDGDAIVLAHGGKILRVTVATGAVDTIPFTARVRREISQQVRSRTDIDDEGFDVRFLQWPTASPEGDRLAFVAVGRVWLVDLPNGIPEPLTDSMLPAVQLTPAWSPDGRTVAFTTWHDVERGHVWTVAVGGDTPRRLTDTPGEYLHPVWSPDGSHVVVSRGPGSTSTTGWNPWNAVGGWSLLRIGVGDGSSVVLDTMPLMREPSFGPEARVYVQWQENPLVANRLSLPFPPEDVLRPTRVVVRSIGLDGREPRDHVTLPSSVPPGHRPMLSPNGRWVAYEASRNVYVADLSATGSTDIVTEPDVEVPGRVRVGEWGGAYHRWRDSTTLEFASGRRYVRYDAATGEMTVSNIRLRVPRPTPSGTIALTGAKIITIGSAGVIEAGDIVVTGARITCVGVCDVASADRVVDATGRVIVPGFVDLHAHHTIEPHGVIPPHRPSSALDLAYGITTIVDPATRSYSAFPLAEMTAAGVVLGPRTFSTGEFLQTSAHAWGDFIAVDTPEDAAHHVRRRADWGAVSIKNYRQPSRAEHQRIMNAARELGITVTSEGGPLYFDLGLAMDGQTGWEHPIAAIPLYGDAATFFGLAGIVYSPTVIVAGHVRGAMEYFRPRQRLLEDAKYRRFMPSARLTAQVRASPDTIPRSAVSFPLVAEGLADIIRAGGYGAIGEHGEQYGIGSHWEVWAYADALSPLEALTVATRHGAYFVGLDHELGSIEPGKLADLVVLDADPLVDIRNTAVIGFVMKGGRLYDDDTLREIWPEPREYGPVGWR